MIATWPIQVSVYQALTAEPRDYPVYDAVPEGAPLPYLVLGEWTGMPDDDLDTQSADLSLTIHGWSQQPGKREAHLMLEFVAGRLDHQSIGSGVWGCHEEFREVMEDEESTAARRIYHAVARYRVRAN